MNQFDDDLYRFAHSFSHQMARRFFQLHDVDFSEDAVKAVKGFPSDLGATNYVMVVRGAALGQEMLEPFVPNDNVYWRFELAARNPARPPSDAALPSVGFSLRPDTRR